MTARLQFACYCGLTWFVLTAGSVAGQGQDASKETSPIQDNSFLVEEAYNQERGVVQHISTFSRMWNSKDWAYSFTQEWPAPGNWRHQLSYTVSGLHAGGFAATGGGLGDTAFNYRYQLIGDGDARFAFSPRVSVLLPTGDAAAGRGVGGAGFQVNLPVSIVLHRRLVSHWNAGSTFVPRAQSADGLRAASVGYSLGQSFVYLATARLNLMLETTGSNFQSVVGAGKTSWSKVRYVAPGFRWALNFANGLQIVPGLAVPFGIGPSAGERGVFLYLSFEHPFLKSADR
jgi:hypothetical protein